MPLHISSSIHAGASMKRRRFMKRKDVEPGDGIKEEGAKYPPKKWLESKEVILSQREEKDKEGRKRITLTRKGGKKYIKGG